MTEKNSQGVSMPLFLEDIYDALKAIVQAAGGPKEVAGQLWSHKPVDQARRELLDALNRDNPRKLDPEEVIAIFRIGRDIGFHQAKHWFDKELSYEPTAPLDPLDEQQRLMRQFIETAAKQERLVKQLLNDHRLPEALRAVK